MLADFDFSKLNTWLLGALTLFSAFAGTGVLLASFKSKSLKTALESVGASAAALKDELEACSARGDRLEKERDEYRNKLHDANETLHAAQIDNAALRAKTDFTPVMEFNRRWYAEQAEVSKQTLSVLAQTATTLSSVMEVLKRIEPKLHV